MNSNCHFKRTYVRRSKTYTLSFKYLTKEQANIICSVFRSLSICGLVHVCENNITTPKLELRCDVPLSRCIGTSFSIPYRCLSSLVSDFNNDNFPSRDIIVSSVGSPLSHLNNY